MEGRFSIDNKFSNVSFEQFREVAHRLKSALKDVRPEIESKLLLTTNREDYYGFGSLTFAIPEVDEAMERREKYLLVDFNEELWKKSFETGLYINDPSTSNPYMVCLTHGIREPKRLFFYGQCLDQTSQRVFESFKEAIGDQEIGDGHPKTSDFALGYVLSKLGLSRLRRGINIFS